MVRKRSFPIAAKLNRILFGSRWSLYLARMKNRTLFLVFSAVILGAVYAYKFTDWFEQKKIQIKFRGLTGDAANAGGPIIFFLDKGYNLTSLKVVAVEESATNKYPHALWHVVSESNSVLITDFSYGAIPTGMKSKIAGLAAEPLQDAIQYRLLVEAGKAKGEKVFQTKAR